MDQPRSGPIRFILGVRKRRSRRPTRRRARDGSYFIGKRQMLSEFDQSTIANMTAALDFVCKKIRADRDSNELRKRIADELMRCARMGRRTLIDLEQAGMKILEEAAKPTRQT